MYMYNVQYIHLLVCCSVVILLLWYPVVSK